MVACRLGAGVVRQVGGILKEGKTLEGERYVRDLESADGFTGV